MDDFSILDREQHFQKPVGGSVQANKGGHHQVRFFISFRAHWLMLFSQAKARSLLVFVNVH